MWFDPDPGVILVSPQHTWMLRAWTWRLWERHGAVYVARRTSERVNGEPRGRRVYLHRQIMGLQFRDPREVDHVNGDTLDNRLGNLEIVTRAENMRRQHDREHREAAAAALERDRAWRASKAVRRSGV